MTNKKLAPYVRDTKGRWKAPINWHAVTLCIFFGLLLAFYALHSANAGTGKVNAGSPEVHTATSTVDADGLLALPDCIKVGGGDYECGNREVLVEWNEYLKSEEKRLESEAKKPTAVLSKVCRDKGFEDTNCPKILYAMAEHESYFGKVMVGDNGKSHGFFHIMYYHNVSKACSEDLACSARWTLNRMIAKGFATNRDNAIRLHNGSLKNPVTYTYLQIIKEKMKLWPNS